MVVENSRLVGEVVLDGKRYKLVRNEQDSDELAYGIKYMDEPLGSGRKIEAYSQDTWHLGGLKTLEGIPGTSEYGRNTDGFVPSILQPAALINRLQVNAGDVIQHGWQDGSTYYFVSDSILYSLDSSGNLRASDFGSQDLVMGIVWQGNRYITTVTNQIYKRGSVSLVTRRPTSNGAGGVSWTPSAGNNWENVDEAVADDDATYNASNTAGQGDLFAHAGFGATDPVSDISLTVTIKYRKTVANAGGQLRIVIYNGSQATRYAFTPPTDTSWHTQSATFYLDPSGNPWTAASLNAVQIGYDLNTAMSSGEFRITQCYADVAFYSWSLGDGLAYWLAATSKRMYGVYLDIGSTNNVILRQVDISLDVSEEDNWADEVVIPGRADSTSAITYVGLDAYGESAVVATNEGVFVVDDTGRGVPLLTRIFDTPTFLKCIEPYIYIGHKHGLWRYYPNTVQACGIDTETLNLSPIYGYVTALASIGPWFYMALAPVDGIGTYILRGHEARSYEPSLGPIIWDTYLFSTSDDLAINQLVVVNAFGVPVLAWRTDDNDYEYVFLPAIGGAPESNANNTLYTFATSGTRYTSRLKLGSWKEKDFYKIELTIDQHQADAYWQVEYAIDDNIENESYTSVDRNGDPMRTSENGINTFYLAAGGASRGKEIQLKLTYSCPGSVTPVRLRNLEIYAIPRPKRIQTYVMNLLLSGDEPLYSEDGMIPQTPEIQRANLEALFNDVTTINGSGPWGLDAEVQITGLTLIKSMQEGLSVESYEMQVEVQRREP